MKTLGPENVSNCICTWSRSSAFQKCATLSAK